MIIEENRSRLGRRVPASQLKAALLPTMGGEGFPVIGPP